MGMYMPAVVMTAAASPGDANGDGKVDINDLTIVLSHFGQTGMTWSQGEFTGDGTVDQRPDIVLSNFGQSAGRPPGQCAAVPEPGPGLVGRGLRRPIGLRPAGGTSLGPNRPIACGSATRPLDGRCFGLAASE